MSPEPNLVERAIARALRDNLEHIQRNSDELQQAVIDVAAACSSILMMAMVQSHRAAREHFDRDVMRSYLPSHQPCSSF
jgi:Rod binding domain-containing protein